MTRYLLKACVTQLTEDRLERLQETPLYAIVRSAFQAAVRQEQLCKGNGASREEVCRRLARRLQGDERVLDVIFRFGNSVWQAGRGGAAARQQHAEAAALAVRWLKGDVLDAEEALRSGKKRPGRATRPYRPATTWWRLR